MGVLIGQLKNFPERLNETHFFIFSTQAQKTHLFVYLSKHQGKTFQKLAVVEKPGPRNDEIILFFDISATILLEKQTGN